MIPVILSGDPSENLSFTEFQDRFLAICQAHRSENRALAFAFILYDFEHAEVIKVLHDLDYWSALDQISGTYLTIFSFHAGRSAKKRNQLGYMVGVDTALLSGPRRFILETFGLDLPDPRPVLLFFQIADDKVLDTYLVKIRSETVEGVFCEIRDVLREAVNSVANVLPEYRRNSAEVFTLIRSALQQRKAQFVAKKVGSILGIQEMAKKVVGVP